MEPTHGAPLLVRLLKGPNLHMEKCLVSRALHRVGFVGFRAFDTVIPRANLFRMMDSCWISRHVERVFASWRASKVPVDLLVQVVGGDGFEPPTPAL